MTQVEFAAAIVGAGPGGLGPLVAAHQADRLDEFLDAGLLFIDARGTFGPGSIGRYAIGSDTYADTLLESMERGDPRVLDALRGSETVAAVEQRRGGNLPLTLVAAYLQELGGALRAIVDAHPRSAFRAATVERVHRAPHGWTLTLGGAGGDSGSGGNGGHGGHNGHNGTGGSESITVRRVLTACGGRQEREHALRAPIAGDTALGQWAAKIMISDELLALDGPSEVRRRLAGRADPRVVVVGGSHSALSSVWALLHLTGIEFDEGAISVLHDRPFRLTYPSREAALADGYSDFSDDDFCPQTHQLYRLAGLRMDGGALLRGILRIGGAAPEDRVTLLELDRESDLPPAQRDLLEGADLIVAAFGYRPLTPRFLDEAGRPITLLSDDAAQALPLVDTECRILTASRAVVPDAFAVGLGSGFRYTGALGGEPSFTGQTNGLWLYQNGIGEMLMRRILAR